MDEINLGDKVRDKLTGIEGTVVAHTKYLTGCDRLSILPESKDGKSVEWWNVDLPLVELVAVDHLGVAAIASPVTGGPQPSPRR